MVVKINFFYRFETKILKLLKISFIFKSINPTYDDLCWVLLHTESFALTFLNFYCYAHFPSQTINLMYAK